MLPMITTTPAVKVKVSELKIGDTFKTEYGTYKCTRAYWAGARNPQYKAMNAVVIASSIDRLKVGSLTAGWKHNQYVELV